MCCVSERYRAYTHTSIILEENNSDCISYAHRAFSAIFFRLIFRTFLVRYYNAIIINYVMRSDYIIVKKYEEKEFRSMQHQ